MTVTSTINKIRLETDGELVDFDFTFPVFSDADLEVSLIDTSTEEATLQTLDTDYSVSISTTSEGGKVTFVEAPASSYDVFMIRKLDFKQTLDIPSYGDLPAEPLENRLDALVMMIQQLEERIDRNIGLPETISSGYTVTLPVPEDGKGIVFDDTINAYVNTDDDINDAATLAIAAQAAAEAARDATVGFEHKGTWSSATTYLSGNIVNYTPAGGAQGAYMSLQGSNLNKNPATESSYWALLVEDGTNALPTTFLGEDDYIQGCYVDRVDADTVKVLTGTLMVEGEQVEISTAITADFTAPDDGDFIDVHVNWDGGTATAECKDSGTSPATTTGSGTYTRLVASFKHETASGISKLILYRQKELDIWWFINGDGNASISEQIPYGVTFDRSPGPIISILGSLNSSNPTKPADLTNNTRSSGITCYSSEPTTSNFYLCIARPGDVLPSGLRWGFKIIIKGNYSFS